MHRMPLSTPCLSALVYPIRSKQAGAADHRSRLYHGKQTAPPYFSAELVRINKNARESGLTAVSEIPSSASRAMARRLCSPFTCFKFEKFKNIGYPRTWPLAP